MVNKLNHAVLFVPTRLVGGRRLYPTKQFLREFYSLPKRETDDMLDTERQVALTLLLYPKREKDHGKLNLMKSHYLVKLFAYPFHTNFTLKPYSWLNDVFNYAVHEHRTRGERKPSFLFRVYVTSLLLCLKPYLQEHCTESEPPYALFDPNRKTPSVDQWFLTNGAYKHFNYRLIRNYVELHPEDTDLLVTYEQQMKHTP